MAFVVNYLFDLIQYSRCKYAEGSVYSEFHVAVNGRPKPYLERMFSSPSPRTFTHLSTLTRPLPYLVSARERDFIVVASCSQACGASQCPLRNYDVR